MIKTRAATPRDAGSVAFIYTEHEGVEMMKNFERKELL